MDGQIIEGVYKDGDDWVRVEERHYPKRRWVVRRLMWVSGVLHYADNDTPPLVPEKWATLQSWL